MKIFVLGPLQLNFEVTVVVQQKRSLILIRVPGEYFLNRPETDGSSVDVVVYDDGVNNGGSGDDDNDDDDDNDNDDDDDDDVDHNDVSDIDDDDDDDCVVLCFFNAIQFLIFPLSLQSFGEILSITYSCSF